MIIGFAFKILVAIRSVPSMSGVSILEIAFNSFSVSIFVCKVTASLAARAVYIYSAIDCGAVIDISKRFDFVFSDQSEPKAFDA